MEFRQQRYAGVPTAKEGEARAVLAGLKWALELEFPVVIIETDCQVVQRAITGDIVDLTEFGVLIDECKLCVNSKPGLSVLFVRRDGNGVAHTLARRSIHSINAVCGTITPSWLSADLANTCFADDH
ncbi:hypothetical protein LINGRAPRIM_LOCUS93 [Linum grandiflorum]